MRVKNLCKLAKIRKRNHNNRFNLNGFSYYLFMLFLFLEAGNFVMMDYNLPLSKLLVYIYL